MSVTVNDKIEIMIPGEPTLCCTIAQAIELRDTLFSMFPINTVSNKDEASQTLERPRDYKQDLVDLGCDPDDLGIVTWNSVTHAVDVSGSVNLYNKGITRLPFQFGKIGKDFWCSNNQLTSLDGAPKEVGGYFWCNHNRLTSLEGCPEKVSGDFDCSDNQLTSLEGCPKEVGGNFGCYGNQLTSLNGAPKEVGGGFGCSYNRLTSLDGCPKEVGSVFGCSADGLTDVSALRGCKIKGGIYLLGPKADQDRVTELLRAQGFKGSRGDHWVITSADNPAVG